MLDADASSTFHTRLEHEHPSAVPQHEAQAVIRNYPTHLL